MDERPAWSPWRWLLLAVVTLAFLLGLRLLARGAHELQPLIRDELLLLTAHDPSSVGAGWLAAYATLNGSLVAAVALTLLDTRLIELPATIAVLFGARFGASGVVLLIGALDWLDRPAVGIARATRVGTLCFAATLLTGVPALALARLWIALRPLGIAPHAAALAPPSAPLAALDPVLLPILARFGPWSLVVLGLVLVGAALKGFDRVVRERDIHYWLARAAPVLDNRWGMFALGIAVTGLTTSVALSIGAIVPLANRDHVQDRSLLPYILGANVGTFSDTLLVAVLLGDPRAIGAVLITGGSVTMVTLALLLGGAALLDAIPPRVDALTATPRRFALVIAGLIALPVGLALTVAC